eukprot:14548188-Alexandrium_andersonii.AAC.1
MAPPPRRDDQWPSLLHGQAARGLVFIESGGTRGSTAEGLQHFSRFQQVPAVSNCFGHFPALPPPGPYRPPAPPQKASPPPWRGRCFWVGPGGW